jgi:hypothetical protein
MLSPLFVVNFDRLAGRPERLGVNRKEKLKAVIATIVLGVVSNYVSNLTWPWITSFINSPKRSIRAISDAAGRLDTPIRVNRSLPATHIPDENDITDAERIERAREFLRHGFRDPYTKFEVWVFHRLDRRVQYGLKISVYGAAVMSFPGWLIWFLVLGVRQDGWKLNIIPQSIGLALFFGCIFAIAIIVPWIHAPLTVILVYQGIKWSWIRYYEQIWESYFVGLSLRQHYRTRPGGLWLCLEDNES